MAEEDDVGLLGDGRVGGERLAAGGGGERVGLGGVDIVDEHGLADPARYRGGHVPGADHAQLHQGERIGARVVRTG